jgi:hypothetical protein
MRTVLSSSLLLCIVTIAAVAEPPPQAAVAAAPAITVADAQSYALPAAVVTQVDSTQLAASSSTAATVDTPRVTAEKSAGHGMGFWLVIGGLALVAAFLLWRYFTRNGKYDTRVSSDELPDRTRPPAPPSGRGSGK